MDLCEYKISLLCRVSSRQPGLHRDTLSQKQQKNRIPIDLVSPVFRITPNGAMVFKGIVFCVCLCEEARFGI